MKFSSSFLINGTTQLKKEINRFLTITKQDSDIDHEEEQRELYILTLQSYVRDALDELDMLEEELVMLQLRREVQASEAERLKEGKNSTPHPLATIPPPGKFLCHISVILGMTGL
jgi:predicted transcriptional regulator